MELHKREYDALVTKLGKIKECCGNCGNWRIHSFFSKCFFAFEMEDNKWDIYYGIKEIDGRHVCISSDINNFRRKAKEAIIDFYMFYIVDKHKGLKDIEFEVV